MRLGVIATPLFGLALLVATGLNQWNWMDGLMIILRLGALSVSAFGLCVLVAIGIGALIDRTDNNKPMRLETQQQDLRRLTTGETTPTLRLRAQAVKARVCKPFQAS